MIGQRTGGLAIVVLVACVAWASSVSGQVIITTPVYESAGAEAVAERAPGHMVNAGLAQYKAAHDSMLFAHPEVTFEMQPSVRSQALAEMARIMFQAIEDAITAIHNVVLLRGGRVPTVLPDVIPAPDFGGGSSANSSGNNSADSSSTTVDLSGVDLSGVDLSNLDLAGLLGSS
ncbi:MAG TPA: hypothetical protein PKK06_11665 [Phycisphaerae bacterium]|nr:hypothetical protein [Phycisphaerae bacterium]HNU45881.1 hypothetical protein [Phycisphaerae bacterium]